MKAILYARVSKDDLHCENQKRILEEWLAKNPCESRLYLQEEMTTRKTRPVKEQALNKIREGKYNTFVVVRIDRFARSLQELVMDVEILINQGKPLHIGNERLRFPEKHIQCKSAANAEHVCLLRTV